MKEGLEEFLKRIEAKPTNETLIDRFVTLVLEEDGLERILYLKKLVGLLLNANPYAALKAAALELQEARKEKLTKEYEVGALKDVESCFLKLDKQDNAQLVRAEISKLQGELNRESPTAAPRTMPPNRLPETSDREEQNSKRDGRQARVHFYLPNQNEDEGTATEQLASGAEFGGDAIPVAEPPLRKSNQPSKVETNTTERPNKTRVLADLSPDAFAYTTTPKQAAPETLLPKSRQKELVNKGIELAPEERDEPRYQQTKLNVVPVGPNLLDDPDGPAEPVKPRNMASVFDATEVFKMPADIAPASRRQNPDMPSSKAIYGESQHVHFPENTSNRSMTRREGHARFSVDSYDDDDDDGTERQEQSRPYSPPNAYIGEDTAKLDPEAQLALTLEAAAAAAVPAFPSRDFDVEPDIPSASQQAELAKERSQSFTREATMPRSRVVASIRHESAPASRESAPVLPMDRSVSDSTLAARDKAPAKRDAMREATQAQPVPREAEFVSASPPRQVTSSESRWHLLRDRLRLLSGVQMSRTHANDFIQRLLGEEASDKELRAALGILLRVLDGPKQPHDDLRFLAFLFEEVQPKALHQLLSAMKMRDQAVVFFSDYVQALIDEGQFRRTLNVIHAVIVPGLDLTWYQEAYRFLSLIWPKLGLRPWQWLEEEGPMAFCERLADREDLLPATLLA